MLPTFKPFNPANPQAAYPNHDWQMQSARYRTWEHYYFGRVFEETIGEGADKAPKYPIQVNLCKTIALLSTYALLGDWEENVFTWSAHSFDNKPAPDQDGGRKFLDVVGHHSSLEALYVRQLLTYSIYGGMVWGIRLRPDLPTKAIWTMVPPKYFFPVFGSLDNELIEAQIRMPISGVEAARVYGIKKDQPNLDYEETWTKEGYTITIEGEVVRRGPTLGGEIPFVYIPRLEPAGVPYGTSAFAEIMGIQNEANSRLADVGDAVNREVHKDVYVSNIPGGARSIRRHGRFVDLGTGLGANSPETHDVDRGQVPEKSFEFVSALVDFSRYSAMTPAVAFGEDEGSQRSGMTLVLRMWPMLQTAKANRTLIRSGLSALARKTLTIGRTQGVNIDTGQRYYEPDLPPLLPRDREQQVLEVSTLWGNGTNPLISRERALDVLNVPEDERAEELTRLEKIRDEANEIEREMAEMEMEMKKQELEMNLESQRQQMSMDREKANQSMEITKAKTDSQIAIAKRKETEMPKKKPTTQTKDTKR
jgi:hypothetical protein